MTQLLPILTLIWGLIQVNSANPVMEANSLQRAITFTQPTQPLEFRENVKKRPKKKNLKKSRLLRKMGADFKPDWMSIDKPANVDAPTIEMSENQVANLVEQVDNLKLPKALKELSSDTQIDSQAIAIFQQWLVRQSSCPVNLKWADLGEYFWPRWIRQGECQQQYGRGCSWPKGMHCVQGQVEMLQILRWHCRKRHNRAKNGGKKRKCKWYKVPYPVTSSCKCACS